jgi:hypothetical protein
VDLLVLTLRFYNKSYLYQKVAMIMAIGNINEPLCLGNAEKFQIWRAVLTNEQPKKLSFYVIRGYVCL